MYMRTNRDLFESETEDEREAPWKPVLIKDDFDLSSRMPRRVV